MFCSSSMGSLNQPTQYVLSERVGFLCPALSFLNASSFGIFHFSCTLPEPGYGFEVIRIPVSILCSHCFRPGRICFEFATRMVFAHVFFELWGL